MEEKLKTTIDKIVQLSKQNEEFNINLRKALMVMPSAKSVLLDHPKTSRGILQRLSIKNNCTQFDRRFCENGVFQEERLFW